MPENPDTVMAIERRRALPVDAFLLVPVKTEHFKRTL
jgi:hypothetical protein